MARRSKMNRRQNRRNFRKGTRVHRRNSMRSPVMRGGIRL